MNIYAMQPWTSQQDGIENQTIIMFWLCTMLNANRIENGKAFLILQQFREYRLTTTHNVWYP